MNTQLRTQIDDALLGRNIEDTHTCLKTFDIVAKHVEK